MSTQFTESILIILNKQLSFQFFNYGNEKSKTGWKNKWQNHLHRNVNTWVKDRTRDQNSGKCQMVTQLPWRLIIRVVSTLFSSKWDSPLTLKLSHNIARIFPLQFYLSFAFLEEYPLIGIMFSTVFFFPPMYIFLATLSEFLFPVISPSLQQSSSKTSLSFCLPPTLPNPVSFPAAHSLFAHSKAKGFVDSSAFPFLTQCSPEHSFLSSSLCKVREI